jgi:hypothetical protein
MDLQISDKVLKQTINCAHNFRCLHAETANICPVDINIKGDPLFIRPLKKDPCPYLIVFGYSYHICKCPTRKELFKRYNK